MSELNEEISTTLFTLVLGAGTFEHKSVPHGRAIDLQSCPKGGEFDQEQFQKFLKMTGGGPGRGGGGGVVEVSN